MRAPGIYLDAGVAGLGLGLGAAAAVAPPAPAGGPGGGCRACAAAAAQLSPGPANAGGAAGSGRDGVGGVGLNEKAVQGGRGALRQAGGLAGWVRLIRVPAVDYPALRDVDAGGAAHPSAGIPRAPPAPQAARTQRTRGHLQWVGGRLRCRDGSARTARPHDLSGPSSVELAAAPPAEPLGTTRVTPTFPCGPSSSLSRGARTHSARRAPAAATLPAAAPQTRSLRLRLPLFPRLGPAAAQLLLAGLPRPWPPSPSARPPASAFPTFSPRESSPLPRSPPSPGAPAPQAQLLRTHCAPQPCPPLPSSPAAQLGPPGSSARLLAPHLGALPSSSAVQRPGPFCTHPGVTLQCPSPPSLRGTHPWLGPEGQSKLGDTAIAFPQDILTHPWAKQQECHHGIVGTLQPKPTHRPCSPPSTLRVKERPHASSPVPFHFEGWSWMATQSSGEVYSMSTHHLEGHAEGWEPLNIPSLLRAKERTETLRGVLGFVLLSFHLFLGCH